MYHILVILTIFILLVCWGGDEKVNMFINKGVGVVSHVFLNLVSRRIESVNNKRSLAFSISSPFIPTQHKHTRQRLFRTFYPHSLLTCSFPFSFPCLDALHHPIRIRLTFFRLPARKCWRRKTVEFRRVDSCHFIFNEFNWDIECCWGEGSPSK